jgi:hypothetical protein
MDKYQNQLVDNCLKNQRVPGSAIHRDHVGKIDWSFNPILPFLIESSRFQSYEKDVLSIIDATFRTTEVCFSGDLERHIDYLAMPESQAYFVRRASKPDRSRLIARPDCMIEDSKLKILETNIGSGVGFLTEAGWHASRLNENLRKICQLVGASALHFGNPVLALAKQLSEAAAPIWFIASQSADGTLRQKKMNQALFRCLQESGLEIYLDKTSLNDTNIDDFGSIYLSISTYQLASRWDEFNRMESKICGRDSNIDCSPGSCLFENKNNLALLSDPRTNRRFSQADRDLFERVLPWTRRVDECVAGMVTGAREKYVLKRGSGHGGRFLVMGQDVRQADFDAALRLAVQEGGWIVQRLCQPMALPNVVSMGSEFRREMFQFVARFFVFGHQISGCFCSTVPVATGAAGRLVSGRSGEAVIAAVVD